MKVFNPTEERIYEDPGYVYEAFTDILQATGNGLFENIQFDTCEGVLTYEAYGKPIKKIFNMKQGIPELTYEVMDWMFSMLDAAANL